MDVTIRCATEKDVHLLIAMWDSIDTFPESERPFGGDTSDKHERARKIIKHCIASEDACTLVTEVENKAIGTISGHIFEKPAVVLTKVGVIYSLWVEEKYRRRGVGSQLLHRIENILTDIGAQSFQVGWDHQNTLAASWWQTKGYSPYETIASKLA